MDVYHLSFVILVAASGWMAWTHHRQELQPPPTNDIDPATQSHEPHGDPDRFRKIFIPVYLLVMGSDWLQVHVINAPPLRDSLLGQD